MQPLIDPEGGPGRVSLQELADRVGVSRSTVSLALRDKGRISEALRQRVKAVAKEMGYWPDPVMSAFSRRRWRGQPASSGSVIAVLRQSRTSQHWRSDLEQAALQYGYRADEFVLDEYASERGLADILHLRGIAGILVLEQTPPVPLEVDIWKEFRGVYCGPYPGDEIDECPFDVVRNDPFDAVAIAWRRAVAAGYRRIGLLLLTLAATPNSLEEKALAAYRYHQRAAKRPAARLEPFVRAFGQRFDPVGSVGKWFEEQRPDLVIASNVPFLGWITAGGRRIPEDVGFICLRAKPEHPEVAGFQPDTESIARAGLKHLHDLIQHPDQATRGLSGALILHPRWIPGPSFPE